MQCVYVIINNLAIIIGVYSIQGTSPGNLTGMPDHFSAESMHSLSSILYNQEKIPFAC